MSGLIESLHRQLFYDYLLETHAAHDEEDLDMLIKMLEQPLPVSFRINLHHPCSQKIIATLMKKTAFAADLLPVENGLTKPPEPIQWYPLANAAWQIKCSRSALSKSTLDNPIKKFHYFLQQHTNTGAIDRQEVVSMLPVLFLSIEPQHMILDMCASPGSKTSQMLDFLMAQQLETRQGLVVANDVDKKRGYMLVHRLSRNTLRHVVVTCYPGDQFPGLYSAWGELCSTNVFDRILCDVPCSGDGTLRKNKALWAGWHIGQGITLHSTQIDLAMRGAALLKIGGTMVYSTCSFNPVENEAVVAEVLRRCEGSLELINPFDDNEFLHGLKYRSGRTKWKVGWRVKKSKTKCLRMNDVEKSVKTKHQWFDHYDQVPQELQGHRLLRSMFPSEKYCEDLLKCIRILPMDQDSGGFFIAVFKKKDALVSWDEKRPQLGLAPFEAIEPIPPPGYICKLCEKPGHYLKKCARFRVEEQTEISSIEKPIVDINLQHMSIHPKYRPIQSDTWKTLCEFYGFDHANNKLRVFCTFWSS